GTALVYAGYIGGAGNDDGRGIAVDSAGNAYVTGSAGSAEWTGFPVTVGPDLTYNGGFDAFVAKVNAAGTGLVYAGYIGGSGDDFGRGIAVDSAGNAYITGDTLSSEATFPVTVGPDLTHNGGSDAFVAKVNAAGTALVYAGYIGGSADDWGEGIAVDSAGNAYVTGTTRSTEATFPVAVGPDLTYNGGVWDAFVAKIQVTLCPARAALEGTPQQEAKLGLLYAFRDEVLATTPTGERYIELFYTHAGEGVWLLVRHPDLRAHTRALLERFLPMLRAIVVGRPATMTAADLVAIEALLQAFAAKASPELQADLKALQEELRHGTVLEQFGIRIQGRRLPPRR
ncbi:MAG: SBBP repeat-containing protein, partial [Candidatus Rokubacteria bacterium]|nr:SBBP repeat-containing protein [Candidatus Rokubacteria bacterium]